MLLSLLGLVPAAAAWSSAGCTQRDEAGDASAPAVRLALADLPEGAHVRVLLGDRPVDVVRGPGGVVARSLWCTHMGCDVEWHDDVRRYRCQCHAGEFDEHGDPVAGPPPRPLRTLVARIEGDSVVVALPGPAS